MKRKMIEKTKPEALRRKSNGYMTAVQIVNDIIVFNIYKDNQLKGRHCMNQKTHEYEQYLPDAFGGRWSPIRLISLLGYAACYYSDNMVKEHGKLQNPSDEETIFKFFGEKKTSYNSDWTKLVGNLEKDYSREKRETAEERRYKRVQELMSTVPPVPEDFEEWFMDTVEPNDYAVYNEKTDKYTCSACGNEADHDFFLNRKGEPAKVNQTCDCPLCGRSLIMKRKKQNLNRVCHAQLMQETLNGENGVIRCFDIEICIEPGMAKHLDVDEAYRIMLFKEGYKSKYASEVYYNQDHRCGHWGGYSWRNHGTYFDNKSNPAHRRSFQSYMYPNTDFEAVLSNTYYSDWTRTVKILAADGAPHHYNRAMIDRRKEYAELIEMLFKNRFYKLVDETIEGTSWYGASYTEKYHPYNYGPLNITGNNLHEILRLDDTQLINRLRACNGDGRILRWFRRAEQDGLKLSDETLQWLIKNRFGVNELDAIENYMSLTKAMNYLERQKAEQYQGKHVRTIYNQWLDYISMCKKLNKPLNDEMTYKPRELRRRHDEYAAEINRLEMIEAMKRNKADAKKKAKEMSEKFPGSEKILKDIKAKFEWSNDEYCIIVPKNFVEIITEGSALHHCVGATERYFDRIMQHETYICFLRKKSDKKIPFYTIEVEPGGTIRQHRGAYDEEPELDKVKPALMEWQKEIRKRMKKIDKEREKISREKRIANIEQLTAAKNTRVLEGLMEDFMEAIG